MVAMYQTMQLVVSNYNHPLAYYVGVTLQVVAVVTIEIWEEVMGVVLWVGRIKPFAIWQLYIALR